MRIFKKQGQRGTSIVEFTVVLGVLLVLLLGAIEGGRAIYTFNIVAHAAKQGVRFIAVRGADAAQDARRTDAPATTADVVTFVRGQAPSLAGATVNVTWPLDGDGNIDQSAGRLVQVDVSTNFTGSTALIPNINISSTASGVIYY
ncbi:pilus assembly protein [Vibrio sp. S4M6]|uniref:TadE/TadG family type IV pilus assembly protein n=1 Tax=Vibrio sinus TaxID=2946865 RepID=UPI00202A293D|nr:TadE/TadG family type IV pilus assembly protein [Vibrio sinus]MCL9781418.1 pilus assembly protein [Vibrio sinus]